MPRTLKILAKGVNARQCSPGDIVTIQGVYVPAPFVGFQAMRAGLTHDTYIEAYNIHKDKQNFKETMLSEEMVERIQKVKIQMETEHNLFQRLAHSICPEIYSMDAVKMALLLLMVGGVTKEMNDGMKIRGTINVLLMGDPGVAKS